MTNEGTQSATFSYQEARTKFLAQHGTFSYDSSKVSRKQQLNLASGSKGTTNFTYSLFTGTYSRHTPKGTQSVPQNSGTQSFGLHRFGLSVQGSTQSGTQSHTFTSKIKAPTLSKSTIKTPKMDNKDFVDFVAALLEITKGKAEDMIKSNSVSVNGIFTTDISYILKVGDIVRAGIEGNYKNSNKGIAIVK